MRLTSVSWLVLAVSWLISRRYVWLIRGTEGAVTSTKRLRTVMRLRRAILLRIVGRPRARRRRGTILVLISSTPSSTVGC